MKLTTETRPIGLLGHPVAHSRSPHMHNAALLHQHLPYVYLAFDIEPAMLAQTVQGIRMLNFRGLNLTIPHKVAIIEHLDEIDSIAQAIGAVNTVINDGRRLIGTNTDGAGYLRSLQEEHGINLTEQRVVMLGAGGAARAVGFALVSNGVKELTILNRTTSKAEILATQLSSWHRSIRVANLKDGQSAIADATCLINTTAVGMHPHMEQIPIDPDWLHEHCLVSDLIYAPPETALLRAAKAVGAPIHNGIGMLLYQAVVAYERWTELPAPVEIMRQALIK